MNMGVPADATITSLHTAAKDTDWHGCTLCEK